MEEVEDVEPASERRRAGHAVEELLQDSTRRKKILRLLLITLRKLGFDETAEQLECDSSVQLRTAEMNELWTLLQEKKYEEAVEVTERLGLNQLQINGAKEKLFKLQFAKLVENENLEEALEFLKKDELADDLKKGMTEALVFGTAFFVEEQREREKITLRWHNEILELCESTEEEKAVVQLIMMELWKGSSFQEKPPHSKLITNVMERASGPAVGIRLNSEGNRVAVATNNGSSTVLTIWAISERGFEFLLRKGLPITADHFEGIRFNQRGSIAVCFQYEVLLLDEQLENVISLKTEMQPRILCAEWHPVSELLYLGGLFRELRVFSVSGQRFQTLGVLPEARQLEFAGEHLFLLSAIGSSLVKYSLLEEAIVNTFERTLPFMEMALSNNIIALSCSRNVYLLSLNLQTLYHHALAPDPSSLSVEVTFYSQWLILLSHRFEALRIPLNPTQSNSFSDDILSYSWRGSGFCHAACNSFVSVSGQKLVLWSNKSTNETAVSEDEYNEENFFFPEKNFLLDSNEEDLSLENLSESLRNEEIDMPYLNSSDSNHSD